MILTCCSLDSHCQSVNTKNDADNCLRISSYLALGTKRFQGHLLGEISESDNSVKALYEACKVESKLAQRKMLGIVNPSLVSIDDIKNSSKQDEIRDCDYCGHTHDKGNCPAYGKICNRCGRKNTLRKKCRQNPDRVRYPI